MLNQTSPCCCLSTGRFCPLCVRRGTGSAELSWRDGIGTDNYMVACNYYNKVYGRGSVKTEGEGWTAQDV